MAEVDGTHARSESVPEDAAVVADQVLSQQEDARRQVITEGEDPQVHKISRHQKEIEEAVVQVWKAGQVKDAEADKVRDEVKSEEEEPRFEREEEGRVIARERFIGEVYGSIRLRYRSTDAGSILGDSGSRVGLEGEWRTSHDSWVYARVEAGFNVLDELDQILSPGGGAGEGKAGDSVFPRIYTVGVETAVVVASYGKSWSTYYRISNFTDRFDSAGGSAVGTFNANTDGGATGTGRADNVLQTRVFVDFMPAKWELKPFNMNIQLQSDQPVPGVGGVNYQNSIGLSAVFEARSDYTFGLAYNQARIDDLNNPVVQAAGIQGDAEAYLLGARWFDEQWYIGFTLARLKNHEATDEGTYFLGWGSELYARYRLIKGYWLVTGYNWLVPDKGETQAGEYELLYGVVGLRYSINEFNRLAYAEWRMDSTTTESGDDLGNIFTIGVRWDF
jgi:predicted porin